MILVLVAPIEKKILGSNPTELNHPAVWYMPKSVKATAKVVVIDEKGKQLVRKSIATGAVTDICVLGQETLHFCEYDLGFMGVVREAPNIKYGNTIGASAHKKGIRLHVLPTVAMTRSGRADKFVLTRLLQRLCPTLKQGFAPPIYFEHKHIKSEADFEEPMMYIENGRFMLDQSGREFHPVIMSVDLETKEAQRCTYDEGSPDRYFVGIIDLVGFGICGYFKHHNEATPPISKWSIFTYTIDFCHEWQMEFVKKLMATPIAKTFSNGMYDAQYLLRWRIPTRAYLHDTEYWWRSIVPDLAGWYSLQDQSNFFLLDSVYWKDGREATNRAAYRTYCGRDCHNTAHIAIAQLAGTFTREVSRNFIIRFARIPFSIASSLSGMEVDTVQRDKLRVEYEDAYYEANKEVREIFGCNEGQDQKLLPYFQGFAKLAKALNLPDAPSAVNGTGKDEIRDLSAVHPMFERALKPIRIARRYQKWLSTYINMDYFCEGMNGGTDMHSGRNFMLWSLQPFGTATGRFSSNGSCFWMGMSAHTLPGDMRSMLRAPEGYVFCTSDAPQSESRVTAHEAICPAMKSATESSQDFHALNASAFFGVPYDEIYDDDKGKTINKPLRDLSKRTNHGANYNMGDYVMLTTMGVSYVRQAQSLLKLPDSLKPKQVTAHLLTVFAERYMEVKHSWVVRLVLQVCDTGRLKFQVGGYSPLMIGDPVNFKPDLNTVIATTPQGESAYISIVGSLKLFAEWLEHGSPVKPILQLHDENITLVPVGTPIEYVDAHYLKCCENFNEMKWLDDTTTTLSIPVGEVAVGTHWNQLKYDALKRIPDKQYVEDYTP